jgi:hypothetical protein
MSRKQKGITRIANGGSQSFWNRQKPKLYKNVSHKKWDVLNYFNKINSATKQAEHDRANARLTKLEKS